MRKVWLALMMVAWASSSTALHAATTTNSLGTRPVTVRDLVEMTRFGTEHQLPVDKQSSLKFSPDGRKFALIVHKGDIETNSQDYSILVFQTPSPRARRRPQVVASLSSSSNRAAITQLRWQGSDSLTFIGERRGELPQVFQVGIGSKKVVQLTHAKTAVVEYAIGADGSAFLYSATVDPHEIAPDLPKSGFPITNQTLQQLYTTNSIRSPKQVQQLFVKTKGMRAPRAVGGPFYNCDENRPGLSMTISHNQEYALVCSYALAPSASWAEYKPGFHTLNMTTKGTFQDPFACPVQVLLVDLKRPQVAPLLDAPGVRASEGSPLFAWSRRNSAVLVNSFLPLSSGKSVRNERIENVYAAEVTIPDRKVIEIDRQREPFHAFELKTLAGGAEFVTNPWLATWGPPLDLRMEDSGWRVGLASQARHDPSSIGVTVTQGMNERPTIVETVNGQAMSEIFDPNPGFAELSLGHVASFTWTMRRGDKMEGALYYPPEYVAGRRYPLIIQTHGYDRDEFWPDGPFSTGYAAQPLAARGFLVLQIPNANPYAEPKTLANEAAVFQNQEEGEFDRDQIESAIEELDRAGLVDISRVGLSGFSRTVYQVLYTITRPRFHYAAAVVADGVNFGFLNCILQMTEADQQRSCEARNGGKPPFGEGLDSWKETAPDFRLDEIEAPLLLQSISEPSGEWEFLSGLRWLKKPVEMINFYPNGEHELVQPRQIYLSEQSVVDWYSFWVQGYEDPDPAKATQYRRWEKLCDLQKAQETGHRAFCVSRPDEAAGDAAH